MNFKAISFSTGLMAFCALVYGCGGKAGDKTAEAVVPADPQLVTLTAEQAANIGLKTSIPVEQEMSGVLKLSGQIDVPPQNLVSVSIPLGGYLKSTRMLPGTHVRKGEVLAVMEDPQYIQLQQDYLIAKNRLGYAAREYERQKELNSTKAGSDKVLQQAESEFKGLSIDTRALQARLGLIGIDARKLTENSISKTVYIYSPISGYISKVNVNIGKYVTPSDVIFELVNPEDIHLNLTVYEKDLDKLAVGQSVTAFTNDKPDRKYATKVILVGHSLGEDRSAEVHCHFERYDKSLVPGMYMNAEIRVKNSKEKVLPEEAFVSFENTDYVFVQEQARTFRMVPVQKGPSENGLTALVSANLDGRQVVTSGAYSLLMKLKNTEE